MASEKAQPSENNQSHQHLADPDGTFRGAVKLQPNNFDDGSHSVSTSLSSGGDVDVWRVHLDAGDTLTASTDVFKFFVPDTQLFLFDNKGTLLAADDDSGG